MVSCHLLRQACGFLLALLVATVAASAESPNPRYADVKVWYGTYSYRLSGKEPHDNGSDEIEASFEGKFTLTQNAKQPNWYDGSIESSHGTVRFKGVRQSNCTETRVLEADGPPKSPDPGARDPDVRLHIWSDKWLLHQQKTMLPGVLRISGCGRSMSIDSFVAFPPDTEPFALPPSGSSLDRTFAARGVVAAIPGGPFQHASWEAEIHLSPTRDEFILDIASADYRTWRPTAAEPGAPARVAFADTRMSDAAPAVQVSSATKGNSIDFTATLRRKSGAPAGVAIKQMRWELLYTSREPGIAINFPVGAKDSDPDLMFAPKAGQRPDDNERQAVVTERVQGATDTATIESHDFGGWTTLRVIATLADGKRIFGVLKETGEQEIAVPKRRKGSLIADAWRAATPGSSGADDDDGDSANLHGGHPGDGLTLYEEYRGFIVQGRHKSGDPQKRELFVRNEVPEVEPGIAKFEKESQIIVHRLDSGEFDKKGRVVNMNHRSGPHAVDQHGVLVTVDASAGSSASGATFFTKWVGGTPGASPGAVEYVGVPSGPLTSTRNAAGDGTPYLHVSFAHEMMHTLGVRHHGQGDYFAEWEVDAAGHITEYPSDDTTGKRTGPGVPIRILNSAGTDVTTTFVVRNRKKSVYRTVGVKHGESSGDDTCMMRYDVNDAYILDGRPNDRVLIVGARNPEPVGYRICTSPKGTGINAPPASTSRYGDAARDCFSQMRVTDRP